MKSRAEISERHLKAELEHYRPWVELRQIAIAAWSVLKSYEYGNVSPDLAKEICKALEKSLGIDSVHPLPAPAKEETESERSKDISTWETLGEAPQLGDGVPSFGELVEQKILNQVKKGM